MRSVQSSMPRGVLRGEPVKSDLPASRVAGGILIGNLIITGLVIASLSMVLVAVWLATAAGS